MTVEVGKPVAEFTSDATNGPFTLSESQGRKRVLYFYPKDNTPGCSTQASDFRDAYEKFLNAGADVIGISRDSLSSHASFRKKFSLPFELISDPAETLCELFGVMKMKNMYGRQVRGIERSTFLVDGNGVLVREWRAVKVPGHVAEVLAAVEAL